MHALHAGALAVLVSAGTVLAQGVAVADPSDSDSSSVGSSGANSPSGDASNGGDPGGTASPGDGNPGDAPTPKLGSGRNDGPTSRPGSDLTAMSPDDKADLADQLAQIDAGVAEVVTLRQQVDTDPGLEPEAVELVDNQADELIGEQQLVHALADEQGITVPPATTPAPLASTVPPQFANMSLDQIMFQVNTERLQMLEAQVGAQAAQIKVRNDQIKALNAQLQDPNLSQRERDAMKAEIDSLTSTSQLEMAQLQSTMNKLNQTAEGLSNWLSKDAQSKNTITGNLR